MSDVMSFRASDSQQQLIRDFARMKNMSISELVLTTLMERIEDEIDIAAAEKAYAEYKADPVTYTHEEVGRMLGIK